MRPEPWDLVIVLIAVVLIFGGNRLPEVVRATGKAIREFKNALTDKNGEAKENPREDSEKK